MSCTIITWEPPPIEFTTRLKNAHQAAEAAGEATPRTAEGIPLHPGQPIPAPDANSKSYEKGMWKIKTDFHMPLHLMQILMHPGPVTTALWLKCPLTIVLLGCSTVKTCEKAFALTVSPKNASLVNKRNLKIDKNTKKERSCQRIIGFCTLQYQPLNVVSVERKHSSRVVRLWRMRIFA